MTQTSQKIPLTTTLEKVLNALPSDFLYQRLDPPGIAEQNLAGMNRLIEAYRFQGDSTGGALVVTQQNNGPYVLLFKTEAQKPPLRIEIPGGSEARPQNWLVNHEDAAKYYPKLDEYLSGTHKGDMNSGAWHHPSDNLTRVAGALAFMLTGDFKNAPKTYKALTTRTSTPLTLSQRPSKRHGPAPPFDVGLR